MNNNEQIPPVEIPFESLSREAANGLIDNFILRSGTDYGAVEIAHETKVQQIRKSIERGDTKVVFDPNTESVTLLTKNEFQKITEKFDKN